MDLDAGLVICRSGVDFGLAGGDGGIALDHLGHHAAHGLDAQGQGDDVQKQDAFDVASQNTALYRSAHRDYLVGVHGHIGGLAGDVLHQLLNRGHTGGTANQQDLVDLADGQARVAQRLLDGLAATIQQVAGDALELRAAEGVVQMLGTACVHGDEGQVDVRLGGAGQLHLGLFRSFLQTLQGHGILTEVDSGLALELVGQPIDDALIPVITAQMVVAGGGANLEHTVAQLKHGYVEGAAAQVEHQDLFLLVGLIEAVCKSSSGGFVDDSQNLQAGDLTCILGCLALCVVEVCGNGDDRLGDRGADLLFGVCLQLLQNHCRDFLGHEILAVDVHHSTAVLAVLHVVCDGLLLFCGFGVGTADEALHGGNGVHGIGDCLVLRSLADYALAVLTETDDGGSGAVAFGVDQDFGLGALHHCHRGISGAQVDTDDLCHDAYPFSCLLIPIFTRKPDRKTRQPAYVWRGVCLPAPCDMLRILSKSVRVKFP